MKIGVVGLGLIGGSLAKAIKEYTKHQVIAWDASSTICEKAIEMGAADAIMEEGNPRECDMVFLAIYPQATIDYIVKFQSEFSGNGLVVDCAGIKQEICETIYPIAKANGFVFCGGHPMAGLERSGFKYSKADLFQGASMILTPYEDMKEDSILELSGFLKGLGFERMQISTPAEHDEMIAYTSQLAHVVSSAYVRSELSEKFMGFSAGSFKDMTRVAKLNETMWTELFMDNSEYLAHEIDGLVERLQELSGLIRNHDGERLKQLLKKGKEIRMEIDKTKEAKEFE